MSQKKPHINIHDALNLDGDPDAIVKHYQHWAKTYDKDVIENYYGIAYIVDLMHKHVQQSANLSAVRASELRVLDVGCGTGLLGSPLHALGYSNLDGMDLSVDMLAVAEKTGRYNSLIADVNINKPLPERLLQIYNVAVCIGVFTPGHVLPVALRQLVAATKPGGLVVLSTRVPYYNTTDFAYVSQQLVSDNTVKLIHSDMNAPYRDDGDAHYWVYEVATHTSV